MAQHPVCTAVQGGDCHDDTPASGWTGTGQAGRDGASRKDGADSRSLAPASQALLSRTPTLRPSWGLPALCVCRGGSRRQGARLVDSWGLPCPLPEQGGVSPPGVTAAPGQRDPHPLLLGISGGSGIRLPWRRWGTQVPETIPVEEEKANGGG